MNVMAALDAATHRAPVYRRERTRGAARPVSAAGAARRRPGHDICRGRITTPCPASKSANSPLRLVIVSSRRQRLRRGPNRHGTLGEANMQMQGKPLAALAAALLLSACAQAQQQTPGIEGVSDAMGATNLNSINYSGSGLVFGFGQAYQPGDPWPKFFQRSYTVSANYQMPGLKFDIVRAQGEVPPHGGAAQPVAGEQRTVQVVSGRNAWSEGGAQANPNPDA